MKGFNWNPILMSLALCVILGGMFFMIEYWTSINWQAVIAFATLSAAFAAAYAAHQSKNSTNLAKEQIEEDRHWRKLDRTFSHSPTRDKNFRDALNHLKNKYQGLRMSQEELIDSLIGKQNNKYITRVLKADVTQLELVANSWGLMASEYNHGLLDRNLSKEIFFLNFMRFGFVFKDWLGHFKRRQVYADTIELYETSKTEHAPPISKDIA